jgi:hypothetical protein
MCIVFPCHFALSSCISLLLLQFHQFYNSFSFDGIIQSACLGMSNDDSDGGESSMHVVRPPTREPPEPNIMCFWHMEWGKEKGKTMLLGTYVFF